MNLTVGFPFWSTPQVPWQWCPQLLHPLHDGTGWAVPARVTGGGAGGTWVVNKGLFSPEWDTVTGASCRTGGCSEEDHECEGFSSDMWWLFDPKRGQLSRQ